MNKRIIEVCCGSADDAIAARQGGARRIELCSALELGGLTPSVGLAKKTKAELPEEMSFHAIIRPRGGDFVYSRSEIEAMRYDIQTLSQLPIQGFAIGALTKYGQVDVEACRELMAVSPHMSYTFHRAFDLTTDPEESIRTIIGLGFDRILTSGCCPTAMEGIETIRNLVNIAGKEIIIMPASGINPSNIKQIESQSGATEFHSTCRGEATVSTVFSRPELGFGENRPQKHTDASVVAALVNKE